MVAQLSKDYFIAKPGKAFSRFFSYLLFEGRPITSKGRFINPLLFLLYKIICLLPQLKKIDRPIFIIGMGRSGTTILGKILSLHKDLGFLNEPKGMWYFSNHEDDLHGNYTNTNGSYKLNDNDVTAKINIKIKKLYAFYLRCIFSKRVLDKYPEMIYRVPFLKTLFPDAKFIFIYRNGWDASASTSNWSSENLENKNENKSLDWWGVNNRKWHLLIDQVANEDDMLSKEIVSLKKIKLQNDKSVIEWILTMNQGNKLMKDNNSNILAVNYENLIAEPENVLSEILEHCELTRDEKLISYAKTILKKNNPTTPFNITKPFDIYFNRVMEKFGYSS